MQYVPTQPFHTPLAWRCTKQMPQQREPAMRAGGAMSTNVGGVPLSLDERRETTLGRIRRCIRPRTGGGEGDEAAPGRSPHH